MADEPAAPAEPVSAELPLSAMALAIIAGAATLAILRYAEGLIAPILLAVLCAYALEPAVALLVRMRLPRSVAAVLVFGALLAGLRGGGRVALDRAEGFVADLPVMAAALKEQLSGTSTASRSPIDDVRRAASELAKAADAVGSAPPRARRVVVENPRFDLTAAFLDNGAMVVSGAAYAVAIALLTFLLLATGDLYKRKILKLGGGTLASRRITVDVIKAIDRQIERYLEVRLLISAIVAALTALALWPLGLRHWLAWGLTAGVLNVLPFAGPTAAVALIGLAALVQFKSVTLALAAVGVSGLVALLEGNLLTPWLTSRAGELNTVAVFVGVLFWGWLWGVWGLLLSVPLLVAVKAAAEHIEALQPLAELLGR